MRGPADFAAGPRPASKTCGCAVARKLLTGDVTGRARQMTGARGVQCPEGRRVQRWPRFVALLLLACWGTLPDTGQAAEDALFAADQARQRGDPEAALTILTEAAREMPGDASIHLDRGAVLGELGRYEEAEIALRAGLALAPAHATGYLTLAKVLVSAHQYAEALSTIDVHSKLTGEDAKGFDVHYVRGLALRRLNRLRESETELRRATELEPAHSDALLNLAAVLASRGESEEAIAYLKKAAGLQPDAADIRYRLAQALRAAGDAEGADAEFKEFERIRARSQRGSRVAVLMRQGQQSLAAGDPEGAKESYQAVIRQEPTHIEAHLNLGLAYERLGSSKLAEVMFRKATELDPQNAEAHLNLGLKLAARGQFGDALSSVTTALELAPQRAVARRAVGMVLTRLDRPHDAVPYFEWLVRVDPESLEARLDLGIALAESGRLDDALSEFREAVRIAPDSHQAQYHLGRVLHDLGRLDDSLDALSRSVSIDGDYAPALRLLGAVERASGRDSAAVEHLREAAKLDPADPLVHYELGLAVSQAKSPAEAIPHWERTLELDPSHRESIYNLAQALNTVDAARSREYRERFAALQAERQDTDRAGTLWNFALAAAKREEWQQAYELFRQALEVCGDCPARGQIHKNFGIIYAQSGDYSSAKRHLEIAQELSPEDDEIEQALQVVARSGDSEQ